MEETQGWVGVNEEKEQWDSGGHSAFGELATCYEVSLVLLVKLCIAICPHILPFIINFSMSNQNPLSILK